MRSEFEYFSRNLGNKNIDRKIQMIRFRDFIKLDLEQLAALNLSSTDDDPKHQEISTSSKSSLDFEIRDQQRSKK